MFVNVLGLFISSCRWVASQSRDLEVVIGEHHVSHEWSRRSDFYQDSWVAGAVLNYLNGKFEYKFPM